MIHPLKVTLISLRNMQDLQKILFIYIYCQLDVFQGKLLRRIFSIKWTKMISNIRLCQIAKSEPWSVTIKRKRLSFLGHVMRLDPETPARMSIGEFLRPDKCPQGRPKKTWMEIIKNDLKEVNIEFDYKIPEEAIDKHFTMIFVLMFRFIYYNDWGGF